MSISKATGIPISTVTKAIRRMHFTESELKKIQDAMAARNKSKTKRPYVETDLASLSYRKSELKTKQTLEIMFSMPFMKQKIAEIYLPYCSAEHIVMFANISNDLITIVKRFAIVSSMEDKRKRIAYLFQQGNLAESRLEKLGVDVRPLNEFKKIYDTIDDPETWKPCVWRKEINGKSFFIQETKPGKYNVAKETKGKPQNTAINLPDFFSAMSFANQKAWEDLTTESDVAHEEQ